MRFPSRSNDELVIVCLLLVLLLLLIAPGWIEGKRSFEIEVKSFVCQGIKPTAINNLTCILYNKEKSSIYVHFNINEIIRNFAIQFTFDILRRDNSRVQLVDVKIDGCKYLASFYASTLFGKFLQSIRRVSKLPTSCPVQRNEDFEIRNYSLRTDDFPRDIPFTNWQLRIRIFNQQTDLYADVRFQGIVRHLANAT